MVENDILEERLWELEANLNAILGDVRELRREVDSLTEISEERVIRESRGIEAVEEYRLEKDDQAVYE